VRHKEIVGKIHYKWNQTCINWWPSLFPKKANEMDGTCGEQSVLVHIKCCLLTLSRVGGSTGDEDMKRCFQITKIITK